MRNVFFSSIIVLLGMLLIMPGCKKSPAAAPPPPPAEETLRISIDAASLSITPGPDFDFNVTVESVMPIAGVKIEYSLKGEVDNVNYPQGPDKETINRVSKLTLSNLPKQKICICTIKVTSKSKTSNTATTGFRVAYK